LITKVRLFKESQSVESYEGDKVMPKRWLVKLTMALLVIALSVASRSVAFGRAGLQSDAHIVREVRHELATLPYYGVFDWLEFEVRPDKTVVLRGQVVRPTTKSDAEARVKQIDGVAGVVNEIEVLPLSPSDERLRRNLYRAIYGFESPLFRYATQAVPPIHIVVNRGRAVLKGIVANKADANLAYIRARGVPGLFDVKSELKIESEMPG
jgi:hyperosmotically inducible protein